MYPSRKPSRSQPRIFLALEQKNCLSLTGSRNERKTCLTRTVGTRYSVENFRREFYREIPRTCTSFFSNWKRKRFHKPGTEDRENFSRRIWNSGRSTSDRKTKIYISIRCATQRWKRRTILSAAPRDTMNSAFNSTWFLFKQGMQPLLRATPV